MGRLSSIPPLVDPILEHQRWQSLAQTLPPVFDHTPGGRTSALGRVVSAIKAMFRAGLKALTLWRMPTTSPASGTRITPRLLRTFATTVSGQGNCVLISGHTNWAGIELAVKIDSACLGSGDWVLGATVDGGLDSRLRGNDRSQGLRRLKRDCPAFSTG